jgi:RNA-directed DNA polymerase
MLTALEKGVKGGKWFSLIDKVYAMPTLRAAFAKVKANAGAAGVDRQTIEMFDGHLEANLQRLSQELRAGSYRPQPVRRQWIPKPGKPGEKRPLGIPTVRDRVAQAAVRNVIEPIYEKDFAAHSYGFRPGRGCKDALRRVSELLKQGSTWVVDADLKSYLDPSSHYPRALETRLKRSGWGSGTLMRRPFLRPRHTCTASSSPRFTRCNTVWRVTPRSRVASIMGT